MAEVYELKLAAAFRVIDDADDVVDADTVMATVADLPHPALMEFLGSWLSDGIAVVGEVVDGDISIVLARTFPIMDAVQEIGWPICTITLGEQCPSLLWLAHALRQSRLPGPIDDRARLNVTVAIVE